MDEYFTIRIRVNGGMVTGFETSCNTPCILADEIRRVSVKHFKTNNNGN